MELQKKLVYTFKIKGRKIPITGFVVGIGNEWILLGYIPVDFVIDGYRLIRRRYIKSFVRNKKEEFIEKVIIAKGINLANQDLDLNGINLLLDELCAKNTIIQFDQNDSNISFVGKIVKLSMNSFTLKNLDTTGLWMEERSFKISSIRTIMLENDYVISLLAYNKTLIPNTQK